MSGVRPFFITGANAKIKLNGKTLAFCTDLSYTIQILTQTPKVLGMYEGSSVEPLGYNVSGSFTVVRYIKDAKRATNSNIRDVASNDAGNGVGNWSGAWGNGLFDSAALGFGNDGRANEALDPSRFDNGTTFDIQVYQKTPEQVSQNAVESVLSGLSGFGRGEHYSGGLSSNKGIGYIGVANIRNCRITQADFSISKKGAAVQRFNFTALYVDEDSFVADFSGRGQHF